jgi:hypothetical protein
MSTCCLLPQGLACKHTNRGDPEPYILFSSITLKRLAWRAGFGLVANFKRATNSELSMYLAKYVAKAGAGLNAWPSRTRWAQTIIAKVPRQVSRGTPKPRGWLVNKIPRFATEGAVRASFGMRIR